MSRDEKERNEKFNLPLIYHFVHDEKQFYIYHLPFTMHHTICIKLRYQLFEFC